MKSWRSVGVFVAFSTVTGGCSGEPRRVESIATPAESPRVASITGTTIQVVSTNFPPYVDELKVTVDQVRVASMAGWIPVSRTPQEVDLSDVRPGHSAHIGDVTLAPGHYPELRIWLKQIPLPDGTFRDEERRVPLDLELEDGRWHDLVLSIDAGELTEHTPTSVDGPIRLTTYAVSH